jgi:hypothetical protein
VKHIQKTRVSGPLPRDLQAKLNGDVAGKTYAELLRRPEVTVEDLVPLLQREQPDFFSRKAEPDTRGAEALVAQPFVAQAFQPVQRSSSTRVAQGSSPVRDASNYDFSPTAHTVATEAAATEAELDSVLPAFRFEAKAASESTVSAELRNELKSVETEIKYSGYLEQQQRSIERLKKAEQRAIPEWFDYSAVSGLSREMNEKLSRVRPRTIGQALNIPGVTPAAASLVNLFIDIQAKQRAAILT